MLLATAAVGALLVVSCFVCAGITYLGISYQVDSSIKEKFGDNPVVIEHLGEIQSAAINSDESTIIQQNEAFKNYIIYDVQGSKGNGQLIIQQGDKESIVGDKGLLRVGEKDFDL